MGNSRDTWDSKSKTDSGDVSQSVEELVQHDVISDVQDLRSEGGSHVVDDHGGETVAEWTDVELGEQSNLGVSDLVSGLDEMHISEDLNRTTSNLGGDAERLEESSLTRVESGRSGRNPHVHRSDGTRLGSGRHTHGEDHVTNVLEVVVGEDESDVANDEWKKVVEIWGRNGSLTDHTADLGVLSHEDLGLSTESGANLLDLVGSDVIGGHHEARGVLGQAALELGNVTLLGVRVYTVGHYREAGLNRKDRNSNACGADPAGFLCLFERAQK